MNHPQPFIIAKENIINLGRANGDNTKRLETSTVPVLIDPQRTVLVVVDMQNFFLNPVLREHPNGLLAYEKLITSTIPACQRAGIDIVFLNWGLTEYDLKTMPPMLHRSFSKDIADVMPIGLAPHPASQMAASSNTANRKLYVGLGKDLGEFEIPIPMVRSGDSASDPVVEEEREIVHAGRLLMRGSWNSMLYGELDLVYRQLRADPDSTFARSSSTQSDKQKGSRAYLVHKNRLSGLWGQMTPFEELLHTLEAKSLLFAGVNTDQCVSGTLGDAFSKGYDCILVSDACGTTSPQYMTDAVIRNTERCWGFVSNSAQLEKATSRTP